MKKIIGILTVLLLFCIIVIPANAEDTGSIYITSEPSAAEVRIDYVVQDHVTPYTFEGIPVGCHDVQVYLKGYMGSTTTHGFFDSVCVNAGQTTSKHYVLQKYEEPKIVVTEVFREHNMEQTDKQLLPGDAFAISVDLSPPSDPGMHTPWRWLTASWDSRVLQFWYLIGSCVAEMDEPFPPEPSDEGGGLLCEEPLISGIVFRIFDSTPFRTFTSIKFEGFFTDWGWGEDTGDRVVEESVDIYVPEFPSPYVPAIAIIGFLGAVLLIKKTREQ